MRSLALILALFLPASVSAQVQIVLTTTPQAQNEFNTIQAALDAGLKQKGGIEIEVRDGTYTKQGAVIRLRKGQGPVRIYSKSGKAVFDGADHTGTFFRVNAYEGPSGVRLQNFTIQRYARAVIFYGGRDDADKWNGMNEVRNIHFRDIGTKAASGETATGVIIMVNSRNNVVDGNTFENIINEKGCGALHALYIAHMSSKNMIRNNRFVNNCGDPIRIRDASNDTSVIGNTFTKSGYLALVTEWYCDSRARKGCTKPSRECPSSGTILQGNVNETTKPLYNNAEDENYPECRQ